MGANRNDCVLFDPTISSVADRGLLEEIETMHLDKDYDNNIVRAAARTSASPNLSAGNAANQATETCCVRHDQERAPHPRAALAGRTHQQLVLELRATPPELRPVYDHRLAQIDLAVACILAIKLIKWADRWSPSH